MCLGVGRPAIGSLVAATRVTSLWAVESTSVAHTALGTSLVSEVHNTTGAGPAAGTLFGSAQVAVNATSHVSFLRVHEGERGERKRASAAALV